MTRGLRRLEPGEPVTPAAVNALVDAVRSLARLAVPGAAAAHRSPAGVALGTVLPPRLAWLEIDEPLEPRRDDGTARALGFDFAAAADEDNWFDAEREVTPLADVQEGLYLAGERRLCWFSPTAGRWTVVDAAQWLPAVLDEPLGHQGSAAARVWRHDRAAGGFADSGKSIEVYDWLLAPDTQLPAGTRVVALHLAHSRAFIVVAADACPEPAP